ncbi:MAG: FKBP-type peptidyl-prolyl cis-trans isomerase [Bacteroidota bacterium]
MLFLTCCLSALFTLQAQPDSPLSLEDYLQKNSLSTQATEDGLHYQIQLPGSGNFPKQGDYVLLTFKAMLLDSTVFDQSHEGEPFIFQVGNREVIKGLDKGIRLLKKGGKAKLFVPPSLGYMQYGVGKTVPPNSPLIYEIELLDVMNFEQYDAFMRDLEERERQEFKRLEQAQFEKDLNIIESVAEEKRLKTKRTFSGLSYAVTKPGKGENAKPGNKLVVAYEGFLADGSPFEKSPAEKPYEFVLGAGKVMDGWEEGLQFFNKGSEGWLLIPSRLAYGQLEINEANVRVPANSVLVFKVKVVEIAK